jgi:hypothetical protein
MVTFPRLSRASTEVGGSRGSGAVVAEVDEELDELPLDGVGEVGVVGSDDGVGSEVELVLVVVVVVVWLLVLPESSVVVVELSAAGEVSSGSVELGSVMLVAPTWEPSAVVGELSATVTGPDGLAEPSLALAVSSW